MQTRPLLTLLVAAALSLSIAAWWNASRTDSEPLSADSKTETARETAGLAPPTTAADSGDREPLGASVDAPTKRPPALTRSVEPAPSPQPLIVTARLAHAVHGLADDEFMLFAFDPSAPVTPHGGTVMRLDRATEIAIPAGVRWVQLQVSDAELILDPMPYVRDPAGAEIELILDVPGSLVVRVLEPWLSRPDVKVYVAGSDRRDIWTEVMEGRGQVPDARGECRFDELLPGSYLVQVENSVTKEGGALKRHARVRAGRTTSIDVGAPDPAPLVLEGIVLRGTEPLAGALVRVGSFELNSGSTAQTDAAGRFEVALRCAGHYHFEIDGYRETREVDALGAAQRFVLPSERLCVMVRDEAGSPRPETEVRLGRVPAPGSDPRRFRRRMLTTQSDGTACFEGLEAGRYVAEMGGAHWIFDESERFAPIQREVSVPADSPLELIAAQPNTLIGQAVFPPGVLFGGVSVYLRPAALPNSAWLWHGVTRTGGSFEAKLLAEGDYELLLISETGSLHSVSQIQVVHVPRVASDPLRIDVTRGTRLCVEARDDDGTPLRMRLDIWTADGKQWPHDGMHTQDLNRQTSKPLPPGAYDVYAYTADGEILHQRVEVDPALSTQRVVLLK